MDDSSAKDRSWWRSLLGANGQAPASSTSLRRSASTNDGLDRLPSSSLSTSVAGGPSFTPAAAQLAQAVSSDGQPAPSSTRSAGPSTDSGKTTSGKVKDKRSRKPVVKVGLAEVVNNAMQSSSAPQLTTGGGLSSSSGSSAPATTPANLDVVRVEGYRHRKFMESALEVGPSYNPLPAHMEKGCTQPGYEPVPLRPSPLFRLRCPGRVLCVQRWP
jgi:hypothetical protein